MSVWGRVKAAYAREFRMAGLADGPQWLIDTWGGPQTAAGERVSIENSMAIADVFSAVDIICESISQLPLKVFRDLSLTPGNPGSGMVEATDHRAWRMLHDAPNSFTPAHRFWSTTAAHLLLWGNAFLWKLRGQDGMVNELRLLDPSQVEVQFNPTSGVKRYRLYANLDQPERMFTADEVLHVFGLSTDGLVGMSRITQAREALGVAKARVKFEGEVYGQKPYLSGVVQHPTTIKDGGVKLRESWRAIYGSGGKDRHGVAVLEEGATFTPITAPLEDMQFVESTRMSKTEIAVLFKLPPSYLGGSTGDSLTYQTVESNKIQLATQAIAPVANNIAQFVSADVSIFPFPSWSCEFVLEGLLRGDSTARATYWKTMKELGVVDEKFIAAKENLPDPPKPKPVPVALQPNGGDPMPANSPRTVTVPVNGNG